MSKCLCINLDKEEYLDFGELPDSSYRDASACNTVEYFLGTEWAGDSVVFAFEGMEPGGLCPEGDTDLFSYAICNFDERCILNSTPKFRYLVNPKQNTYYDKLKIPMGDNGSYLDPISLLLSATKKTEIIDLDFSPDEIAEIGLWSGDGIFAVNNIALYPEVMCFVPAFRNNAANYSGNLSGMHVVVTGTFPNYDRAEIEELIRRAGGTMQRNITKKTDFLVVANNPGRTKLYKARENGIREITADEFMDML